MSRNRNRRQPNRWVQKKHNKKLERQAWMKHWEDTANQEFTLEEIGWLVANIEHEGCVFDPDATNAIHQMLKVHNKGYWLFENRRQCMDLVLQSAIYYPAEGIDRRAEYGMKVE